MLPAIEQPLLLRKYAREPTIVSMPRMMPSGCFVANRHRLLRGPMPSCVGCKQSVEEAELLWRASQHDNTVAELKARF
jgi:hypothetical protein